MGFRAMRANGSKSHIDMFTAARHVRPARATAEAAAVAAAAAREMARMQTGT